MKAPEFILPDMQQKIQDKEEYFQELKDCLKVDRATLKQAMKELRRAEALPTTDENPELLEMDNIMIAVAKMNVINWKYILPLLLAWNRIIIEYTPYRIEREYRLVFIEKTHSKENLGRKRVDYSKIYGLLKIYKPVIANNILKCVHTQSLGIQDKLIAAFNKSDEEGFNRLLLDEGCDYYCLSKWLHQAYMALVDLSAGKIINSGASSCENMILAYMDTDTEPGTSIEKEYRDLLLWQLSFNRNSESENEGKTETGAVNDSTVDYVRESCKKMYRFLRLYFSKAAAPMQFLSEKNPETKILSPILESEEFKQLCEENKELIEEFSKLYTDDPGPESNEGDTGTSEENGLETEGGNVEPSKGESAEADVRPQNNVNVQPSLIPDGLDREEMKARLEKKYSLEILSAMEQVKPKKDTGRAGKLEYVYYEDVWYKLNGGGGKMKEQFLKNLSKIYWTLVDLGAIEMTDNNYSLLLLRFGGIDYGRSPEADKFIDWLLDKKSLSRFIKSNTLGGGKFVKGAQFFKVGGKEYDPKQASPYADKLLDKDLAYALDDLGKSTGVYVPEDSDSSE